MKNYLWFHEVALNSLTYTSLHKKKDEKLRVKRSVESGDKYLRANDTQSNKYNMLVR